MASSAALIAARLLVGDVGPPGGVPGEEELPDLAAGGLADLGARVVG